MRIIIELASPDHILPVLIYIFWRSMYNFLYKNQHYRNY